MTKNMSAKIVDFLIDIGFKEDYPRGFYTDRNLDEIHFQISERTINLSRDKKEMIKNIIIDAFNSGFEEGEKIAKDKFGDYIGLNKIREAIEKLKNEIDSMKD